MQQLRLAERCGRLGDVAAWLDEIDADAYAELVAYDDLQPSGWEALRIAIRRLGYLIAAAAGARKAKERQFDVVIGGSLKSDRGVAIRWEAMAIRTELEQQAKTGGTNG